VSQRRRCHHLVSEHRLGGSRPQHVGVIDMGPARRHGVHERQDLPPRPGPTDTARQVDGGVDQAFETEADNQCGHQNHAGIGHQVGLVEGHLDAVDSARYCGHKSASWFGDNSDFVHRYFPKHGGAFRGCAAIYAGRSSVYRGLVSR